MIGFQFQILFAYDGTDIDGLIVRVKELHFVGLPFGIMYENYSSHRSNGYQSSRQRLPQHNNIEFLEHCSLLKLPLANVGEVSRDRCRGGHHRADQVRAPAASLPPFEISIARRGAPLARLQNIGIHTQAHRASRLAPLEARFLEDPMQTLVFSDLL